MESAPPSNGLPPGFVLDAPSAQPRRQPSLTYIDGPPREPSPQTAPQVQQDINSAANSGASAARTTALTPLEVQRARAEARKAEIDAASAARAAQLQQQQQGTVGDAKQEIQNVIDAARRAQRLSREGGVSGRDRWVGSVTRVLGGTALNDLDGALDTVRSNIAFSRLQRMRQESPTGGAVGNVSDSDLRLLASTIASLDRSQSDEVFEGNLQRVIDSYQRVYDRLGQGAAGPAASQLTNAAVAGAQAPGIGPQDGSPPPVAPSGPPDQGPLSGGLTVQPGESMGQVGAIPVVPLSENGRNVAGAAGDVLTPADRRIAGVMTALANSRLSADETIARGNAILRAAGRNPLTPEAEQSIRSARANHSRHPGFSASPGTIRSQQEQAADVGRNLLGAGGAPEAAVANALDAASFGLPNMLPGEAGRRYREAIGDLREAHPTASTVGTIIGGIASPGGPRPGMGLLEQTGRSMGQGAAYGFFESGGDPVNALAGGAIGAAAPGAFNLAGRAVRPVTNFLSRANVTPEAQAVAQAGADEGVTLSRPVVDPTVRDRMAYLEASPGTGNTIRGGLQATRDAIEARAGELGNGGTVQPNGVIGQQVQDAGERYIRRSGDVRTRLYDRAAQIAGDAPVHGQEAVQAIDSALAELAPNAPVNQGQISYLQNLRRTFVDDQGNLIPRTVQSIRDLRTEMRGHIDNGTLTRGPAERRVLNVLGAAKQDIERDLGQANPAAVRAYQRADRFNAERASEIKQVVQRVIGRSDDRLSGEQVMTRLRTMAGNAGDAGRLARVWDKLSPEEAADAAATIASTAGRRSAEEGFEPGQFIAWARTLSPEARQTIFGPQGAQSIANLRVLSKALMDTSGRLNNSRSGVVANWGRVFRDMMRGGPVGAGLGAVAGGSALASGGAGLALGAASAGAGLALRRLSARALMNPDMSRWLAGAARVSTPSAIRQHIARLAVVERSNPALTQEITGLRQALLSAVNDNVPLQAAASGNEGQNDQ